MLQSIPTAEFIKHYGIYADDALKHPIIIQKHNRNSLVLVSYKEFDILEKIKEQYNDLLLKLKMDEVKKRDNYVGKEEVLKLLAEANKNDK